jgi:putative membrane-bound dehydrogenase-like protein
MRDDTLVPMNFRPVRRLRHTIKVDDMRRLFYTPIIMTIVIALVVSGERAAFSAERGAPAAATSAKALSSRETRDRLVHIDSNDPYYVHRGFPKLTTPQWVGERGVDAVVVLAIDDMTDNADRYETYLKPIIDRLRAIDGRGAVSVMTCHADPRDPRIQRLIEQGVAIDVHTIGHPCPLFAKGDFEAAVKAVHGGIDLLAQIPNNRPVAFRMPCCDSLNTPSPRFFAEIFNRPTADGKFLTIDSSVFVATTPNDPEIPRSVVLEADGGDRFRKYLPFPAFVNTIEDYPYPYVIGKLCWEFPCIVPSDWEAFHVQKAKNPKTVEDLKRALDAVVVKQGVMNIVFHPHGWIDNAQIVEFVDYANKTYGGRVKFLNFHEAQTRIDKNLLNGSPIRAVDGGDGGVRLIDVNDDGYLDVLIGNDQKHEMRIWNERVREWESSAFPPSFVYAERENSRSDAGFRFGLDLNQRPYLMKIDEIGPEAWAFDGSAFRRADDLAEGLVIDGLRVKTIDRGRDTGVRLRDLDGDGTSEAIVAGPSGSAVFGRDSATKKFRRLPFALPDGARIVDDLGRDAGTRFVDLDDDLNADVIFSNDQGFGAYLFESMKTGWSIRAIAGGAGEPGAIPKIVHNGMNNGAFFQNRSIWVVNETTDKKPDLVERMSFNEISKNVEPRGKTAEAALRSIRVRRGFRVEIAACEPLVNDPIAFDWGADGSMWVVEMGDYPLGADNKGKPGGSIRRLVDLDGDGIYDQATTFLDGLSFPTGVMPVRKGVIVTCAPDIFYAEDRDGDGKADYRETLFSGFVEGNPQHRVNGFDLGLDGWVYVANGDSGGKVRSQKTNKVLNTSGRDFAFRVEGLAALDMDGDMRTATGGSQYGRRRDDWGNWFGNNNPTWLWHNVFSEEELHANPAVAVSDPRRIIDRDNRIFPISRTVARFNSPESVNRTTSANSPTPYRDDLFGPGFERSVFVSEPVHNVIHRIVLEPSGPTFAGGRASDERESEFLASSDNWFRPTSLKTGPDGALWIADMDRAVIEHPEWIPDDWEKRIDLRAGADRGRIFRVVPVGVKRRPIPRLDRLEPAGLIAALDSPNGWTRDTIMRLLGETTEKIPVDRLISVYRKTKHPQVKVQILHIMENMKIERASIVSAALADQNAEVRRHGVQTADLKDLDTPIGSRILELAGDPDARVRFSVAFKLAGRTERAAGSALAAILDRDRDDPLMRTAVLLSSRGAASIVLANALANGRGEAVDRAVLDPLLATIALSRDVSGLDAAFKTILAGRTSDVRRFAAVAGLFEARSRVGGKIQEDFDRVIHSQFISKDIDSVMTAARRTAEDEGAVEGDRLAAISALGRSDREREADRLVLARLLDPKESVVIERAAIEALSRIEDAATAKILLKGWKGRSPLLRDAILDVLTSRPAWSNELLNEVEAGRVGAGEIDPARRRTLLASRDESVRIRASMLIDVPSKSRKEIIKRYQDALTREGDPRRGFEVFKKTCAGCHRLGGMGNSVGPDLATLTDRSKDSLLTAILDPNRAFEAKFTSYAVSTTDGRVTTGMIAAETATSVTLRRQEMKEDILLKSMIDEISSTGQSLMPEGIEKDVSPSDMADLIAFVAGASPISKAFPGNRPEVVEPGAKGGFILPASRAKIFGDTLVFESKYGNLGYFSSANDRAEWTIRSTARGRYAVWVEQACPDETAGSGFAIEIGANRFEAQARGTGGWDEYRRFRVATVELEPGEQTVAVRSSGAIKAGAIADIKSIELRPLDETKKVSK